MFLSSFKTWSFNDCNKWGERNKVVIFMPYKIRLADNSLFKWMGEWVIRYKTHATCGGHLSGTTSNIILILSVPNKILNVFFLDKILIYACFYVLESSDEHFFKNWSIETRTNDFFKPEFAASNKVSCLQHWKNCSNIEKNKTNLLKFYIKT